MTVFSLHRGKISVLAKGVRRITSRRAGNVELLNRSILYLHQGKGMPILTEAQTLQSYQKIKEDLTLSTYAYHLLELVDTLTAENQENKSLYHDLVEVLERLSKNPRQIFIRAFEAKILSKMGFVSFQGVAAQLETLPWQEIEKMILDQKEALELERVLRYHVERVIEGPLKSRQFLKKL